MKYFSIFLDVLIKFVILIIISSILLSFAALVYFTSRSDSSNFSTKPQRQKSQPKIIPEYVHSCERDNLLELDDLESVESSLIEDNKKIFFIETSDKKYFTPREACAVESASRMSNLNVYFLRRSSTLSLQFNATCQLYQHFKNIKFLKININQVFRNTPLEGFDQLEAFTQSNWTLSHLSDSLRFAVIYKYGGFYSDLDTVTIKDLSNFENVFASSKEAGNILYSGNFHLHQHHPLLENLMKNVMKNYKGMKRTEIGPLFGRISISDVEFHVLFSVCHCEVSLQDQSV